MALYTAHGEPVNTIGEYSTTENHTPREPYYPTETKTKPSRNAKGPFDTTLGCSILVNLQLEKLVFSHN